MLRTQVQTLDWLLGGGGVQKNILKHNKRTSKYPTAFLDKNTTFLEGSTWSQDENFNAVQFLCRINSCLAWEKK